MSAAQCHIAIDGKLPRATGLTKAGIRSAARCFAAHAEALARLPFREVTVILQDDTASAAAHLAIMNAPGATDVITQRYDAMPGERPGVYGELYVNVTRAQCAAPKRRGWDVAHEILLYVAHGMDHLSGADDHTPTDFTRMRRRELKWIREISL